MKSFKLPILAALVVVFAATMIACSNFNPIKKAFEKDGFTYAQDLSDSYDGLVGDAEEMDLKVKPHLFTKSTSLAIVLEFQSSKDMDKYIAESETAKGFLKDLQKSDFVNGNCLLLPIELNILGDGKAKMIEIFKNA